MLICINKVRDKHNNIIAYNLRDTTTGNMAEVQSDDLKDHIRSGLTVVNLRLTKDDRLIDDTGFEKKHQEAINSRKKLFREYSTGNNKGKLSYTMSKLNSPRVGKLMARALLIGLTCASLSAMATGCGATQPLDLNAAGIEQSVETASDKIDKLNSATEINVDVKHLGKLTMVSKAVISVDDEEIGTIQGKFIKIFDTLKFTDANDNQLAKGDQDAHIIQDRWIIYNSDDEPVYTMRQALAIKKKYIIADMEGNDVAWLQANLLTTTNSGKVYDMEDNVIAEIKQGFLRKDFKIEIKEGSEIDNTSMTTICTNYMMQQLRQQQHNGGGSSSKSSKE